MKTASFSFAAALVALLPLPSLAADATAAPQATAAASMALVTGHMSARFMDVNKGTAVKVAQTADGSRVDLATVDGSKTIHFYFDPVTTKWPREIERVVEVYNPSGKLRGGYSHGEVNVTGGEATFKGSGFVPVSKFSFNVK